MSVPFFNVKSANISWTPEGLINLVFTERVKLGSSSNLNEYILNRETAKKALSNFFLEPTELIKSLVQFDIDYKSMVDENCEAVKFTPLIRVYRIDKNDNIAVAYVEQFLMYRVKLKPEVPIRADIPKEYIVPTDINGAWVSAGENYYTVTMKKVKGIWKINKFIDADIEGLSEKAAFLFAGVNNFQSPPQEKLPLPQEIIEELQRSSIGYDTGLNGAFTLQRPSYPTRSTAAQYADTYWSNYNTQKYATFPNDCANFASQCLYEGGWNMDWNNNGVTEQGYPNNRSQEWHINTGTTNSSLSWIQADTLETYIRGNWDYMNGVTKSPFGKEAGSTVNHVDSYTKAKLGDIVTLDRNSNNSPDHVGVVASIRPDGVPLVDAHTNDCYHASWKDCAYLFHTTKIDYELIWYGTGP